MKTVLFSGLAAGTLLIAAGAAQASDSWSMSNGKSASDALGLVAHGAKPGMPHVGGGNWNGPKPGMGGNWNGPKPGMPHVGGGNWNGPRPNMPNVSWHPRPGYHGIPKTDIYRRPYRGFTLANWWVQPTFYIPNYTIYGLGAPSSGYYWSRYYDDAVLINNQGYVADYRSGINWDGYPSTYSAPPVQYQQPQYGPAIRPDAQAYNWGSQDGPVYDGAYDDSYGDDAYYEQSYERVPAAGPGAPYGAPQGYGPPPGYAPQQAYRTPAGYEGYEKCLKSNGVTGAAIGAVIGGVAGNQIAGRGDKLGGTLLGVGLGGITGAVIEKATSKCKSYAPQYRQPAPAPYPPQSYGPPPAAYPPGYGQQYGYYQGGYYYAQPQVTVTVVPATVTTTTVTSEEYVYETVSVPVKKRAIVKKWKPKPKPVCTCR